MSPLSPFQTGCVVIVGSKNPTPCWLSPEEAEEHCVAGASVWEKYSTDKGVDPDVVIVGCGVEVTFEAIAAAAILRNEGVRVRFVNVTDLMVLGDEGSHPHALSPAAFNGLFTAEKPVVVRLPWLVTAFPLLILSLTPPLLPSYPLCRRAVQLPRLPQGRGLASLQPQCPRRTLAVRDPRLH